MADWQGGEEGAKASLFERVHTLGQHAQSVSSVKFSPSGDIVASTGADGSVKLFSTSSLELLRAFSLPSAGLPSSPSPSPVMMNPEEEEGDRALSTLPI